MSYESPEENARARASYSSEERTIISSPKPVARAMLAATREHILWRWRGKVRMGVPDQRMSAAVVWALTYEQRGISDSPNKLRVTECTSVVSRNKSAILPRWMWSSFCATSVKMTRSAISGPAHLSAISLRCASPGAGKRSSQRIELRCLARIESQMRKT